MKLSLKIKSILFKFTAQKKYNNIFNPKTVKKILIIREGGIGDAICIYPLLHAIKRHIPECEIDIYAGRTNHFMYKYTPYINNIYIKYRKRYWYRTFLELFKMKKRKYDLCIDTTIIRFTRSIHTMFINPAFTIAVEDDDHRYGFNRKELSFYHTTYPQPINMHVTEHNLQFLQFLHIDDKSNNLDFFLPIDKIEASKKFLSAYKEFKTIGLNTDGTSDKRTLSETQILKILNRTKHPDVRVILFCMPHKRDYFNKLITTNNLKNVSLTYETKDIYDAAAIIQNLDLLISPDTSFVHIASAFNTPIVGLYWNTPVKTVIWGPLSTNQYIVTAPKVGECSLVNINIDTVVKESFRLLNISQEVI